MSTMSSEFLSQIHRGYSRNTTIKKREERRHAPSDWAPLDTLVFQWNHLLVTSDVNNKEFIYQSICLSENVYKKSKLLTFEGHSCHFRRKIRVSPYQKSVITQTNKARTSVSFNLRQTQKDGALRKIWMKPRTPPQSRVRTRDIHIDMSICRACARTLESSRVLGVTQI